MEELTKNSTKEENQQEQGSQLSLLNEKKNKIYWVKNLEQFIPIKSKFEADFRRFLLKTSEIIKFEDFYQQLETFHILKNIPFTIYYIDPLQGDLLPINNDDNLAKAISCSRNLLRLNLQRKGKQLEDDAYNKKKNNFLKDLIPLPLSSSSISKIRPQIGHPQDFREVSSIIDVDVVPETCRRVRLVKHGPDKPLGFYIRDGTSVRVLPNGVEKVPGVFISRLVPGGLAEGTGILAINDEILEVNGIEVLGKTLDQVTDMMIANSSNLIITIRPANQQNLVLPNSSSLPSISDEEEDEIKDLHLFS